MTHTIRRALRHWAARTIYRQRLQCFACGRPAPEPCPGHEYGGVITGWAVRRPFRYPMPARWYSRIDCRWTIRDRARPLVVKVNPSSKTRERKPTRMRRECCDNWAMNVLLGETDLVHVRADGFPVTPGHALVIPKRHVTSYLDLNADEVLDMHAQIIAVCRASDATSFTLGINEGRYAGRSVDHAHFHVIPRRPGDVPDPIGGLRRILIPDPADDPYQPRRAPGSTGVVEGLPWTHGTRLGRDHRSVRRHLVEDHSVDQDQVDAWSDGAVHGHHDGVHGRTWAYAEDLEHPAPGDQEGR